MSDKGRGKKGGKGKNKKGSVVPTPPELEDEFAAIAPEISHISQRDVLDESIFNQRSPLEASAPKNKNNDSAAWGGDSPSSLNKSLDEVIIDKQDVSQSANNMKNAVDDINDRMNHVVNSAVIEDSPTLPDPPKKERRKKKKDDNLQTSQDYVDMEEGVTGALLDDGDNLIDDDAFSKVNNVDLAHHHDADEWEEWRDDGVNANEIIHGDWAEGEKEQYSTMSPLKVKKKALKDSYDSVNASYSSINNSSQRPDTSSSQRPPKSARSQPSFDDSAQVERRASQIEYMKNVQPEREDGWSKFYIPIKVRHVSFANSLKQIELISQAMFIMAKAQTGSSLCICWDDIPIEWLSSARVIHPQGMKFPDPDALALEFDPETALFPSGYMMFDARAGKFLGWAAKFCEYAETDAEDEEARARNKSLSQSENNIQSDQNRTPGRRQSAKIASNECDSCMVLVTSRFKSDAVILNQSGISVEFTRAKDLCDAVVGQLQENMTINYDWHNA